MLKISREIKVAVLVILSIILFYWGFQFLKGRNVFDNTFKLYATYGNVAGLTPASPVTLNGLVIGKIKSITVQEKGEMLVEMDITNNEIGISKNAIAEIESNSIMGGKEIALINNFVDKDFAETGFKLKSGYKLGLTESLGAEITPVKKQVEVLLNDVTLLIKNLNNVLDQATQNNLKSSIASLNKTMEEINKTTVSVNGLIADNKVKLNSTLTNFDKTSQNLNKVSESVAQADLKGTINKLEATLNNVNGIMSNLEQGKGTMGKLLKDDAMYTNLTKTSKELELLLQDLRLHPTRYVNVSVFGKKNKPYVAPADNQEEPKK
jgi:phospholipid/cholesterol/gamma-HCH transport system substrate-binding protein